MNPVIYEDYRDNYDPTVEQEDKTILKRLIEKQDLKDFMRSGGRIPMFRKEIKRRRTRE